ASVVVSKSQGRAQDERWEPRHASTDVAQIRTGGGDEGNPTSAADELCFDSERALGLQRIFAGTGTNRESRQKITPVVMPSGVDTSLIVFSDGSKAFLALLGLTKNGKEMGKFC